MSTEADKLRAAKALIATLLEALLDARSQLEVYEWESTGENFNDTRINKAIELAEASQ